MRHIWSGQWRWENAGKSLHKLTPAMLETIARSWCYIFIHLSRSHKNSKKTSRNASWRDSFTTHHLKVYFHLRKAVETTERGGRSWKKAQGGLKTMVNMTHLCQSENQKPLYIYINCRDGFPLAGGMFEGLCMFGFSTFWSLGGECLHILLSLH